MPKTAQNPSVKIQFSINTESIKFVPNSASLSLTLNLNIEIPYCEINKHYVHLITSISKQRSESEN